MLIAKKNGTPLIDHSIDVYEHIKKVNTTEYLTECLKCSALLHDIGKCVASFQNYIIYDKISDTKFLHNEIGWAFIKKYMIFKNINGEKIKEYICDSVYWHHGIDKQQNDNSVSEILDTITSNDVDTMKQFVINILDDSYLTEYDNVNDDKTPKYFSNNSEYPDYIKMYIRYNLISADRFNTEESIYRPNINYDLINLNKNKRFHDQMSIIDYNEHNTIIVNAPAGFGKTIIGILKNIKNSNRKLIWVCPRNIVAESLYINVLSELKLLNINAKVELYLTGEVKESNSIENDFNSDIIITNIDNFLTPMINNNIYSRVKFLLDADIVFDEYHELITEDAYFALFVNIMKMRTELTNSKTLLLSATPTNVYRLWDKNLKNTIFLPSINKHFDPVHTKKYKVNIPENIEQTDNTLYVYNSIKSVQEHKKMCKNYHLLHSKFTLKDRVDNFNIIFKLYNKESLRNTYKASVIGTHIIQASLDLSFNTLYDSILSPESTIQRIGRTDRWGGLY